MDFLLPGNARPNFLQSGAVEFDGEDVIETDSREHPSLTDLITLLVISRAAAVRSMDYDLADEYLKLACVGHLKPAVYAAVLGIAS